MNPSPNITKSYPKPMPPDRNEIGMGLEKVCFEFGISHSSKVDVLSTFILIMINRIRSSNSNYEIE
jgi:hypothetical protein